MPDNKLELVVEVDVDRANASIKSINRGLSSFEQAAAKAGRGAAQGIDGFTVSVARGAAAGALLAGAFERVLGWAKEAGLEIVKYAARTETLTVVTSQLAKVNGYEEGALSRLVERVKALGISTQEAHGVVQRMVFAQLDLSKATQLARVAQDAAVISGVNSSEALENIIIGITTGQTRLLHNMGLQVSLEQVVQQKERELGRTVTERERREAMLNAVLGEGVKIHGAYEAAMGTAGKQMTSLTRYWQEAKNAIGEQFLPEMRAAIAGLVDLAKWVKDNADTVAKLAKTIGSAVMGVAIRKFVGWVNGATKAVGGLTAALSRNWVTLLITGAVMAGQALYEMYQDSLKLEEQLKEQNKVAAESTKILYEVERGKTVDDLKRMGYSVDQIRRAFLGAREGADEFLNKVDDLNFGLRIKLINSEDMKKEAARQAQEMAREMGKKQNELGRSTLEAALTAERASIGGPGRALLEFADKARKATIFVDKDGNEHAMRLTTQIIQNLGREHAAKMVTIQKDSAKEILDTWKQEAEERLKWDTEVYQQRIKRDEDVAARALDHSRAMYEAEEGRLGQSRDAQVLQAETLRRGGWLGVGEATAGGALIGYKFGGPLGAAIGAGVGFAAGLVRLFVKGATQKAREKIRATYGVDISDKGVLTQIVSMAKEAFGGNLDMAIRSQQVRDIIELYAMSTGQRTTGLPGTLQPVNLVQSGGSLYQAASSGNSGLGGLATLDRIGGGVASGGGPVVIQLDGPATTALLRGEAVQAIVENPRAVQGAAMNAQRSNSGRRQMASLQLSPGLLTT